MMPKRRVRLSGSTSERSLGNWRIAHLEQLEPRMLLTSLPYGAVAQDTGEYMLGDAVATVVFFESDGSIDENLENWTPLLRDGHGNVVFDSFGHTISANGEENLVEKAKARVVEGHDW